LGTVTGFPGDDGGVVIGERSSRAVAATAIAEHHAMFRAMVRRALATPDEEQRVEMLGLAAQYATGNVCGIYSDWLLESGLLEVARRRVVPMSDASVPGSFIHVMTRTSGSGGHSRVVARWIDGAPAEETHSVVLLAQDKPVPEWLTAVVKRRGGTLVAFAPTGPIEAALSLRTLASGFERVVLHADPGDVVPVLAFGADAFARPVLLYNHADHIFWVGVSIADLVVDIGEVGQGLTLTRRGARRSAILPVPLEARAQSTSRAQARHALGVGPEIPLVVTSGHAWKFRPTAQLDFTGAVAKIVDQVPRARVVALGPSRAESRWAELEVATNGRILPAGVVDKTTFERWIAAADVYLDPFPVGSGTAVVEAALAGTAVVSLRNGHVLTPFDSYRDTAIQQPDVAGYVATAVAALQDAGVAAALRIGDRIHEQHCAPGWPRRLAAMLSAAPVVHHVTAFAGEFAIGEREEFVHSALLSAFGQPGFNLQRFSRTGRRNKLFVWSRITRLSACEPGYLQRLLLATISDDYDAFKTSWRSRVRLVRRPRGSR
jgi:glycosyltransferase involved in cell wall biosynthesis